MWRALAAALAPVRLADLRDVLGRIVTRLRSYDPNEHAHTPRKVLAFRQRFASAWAEAA